MAGRLRVLQEGDRELRMTYANTAQRPRCKPAVARGSGDRCAWGASLGCRNQEHAAMRPVCNVRLATWRPVRINPQCELMPPAPPATPLPVWDTPQAMRRLQT